MRKSRFSEEQIIAILKEQAAGVKTAEVCRRHGISQPTFYAWKSKFGGMEVSEAKRLKALGRREPQAEETAGRADARQLDAQRDADKKLLTPGERRNAVSWAINEKSYSQARACGLVGMHARTFRRKLGRKG